MLSKFRCILAVRSSTSDLRGFSLMALSQEVTGFVQAAVRLPEERLRRVDRAWERLQPYSAVVAELVRGNPTLLEQARELREFVIAEARRTAAEREKERLIPEDIAEAVLPTARALLLRKVLENSSDQRRAQAFTALTAPFADILLPGPGGGARPSA
jgi:hypothetical protein